MRAERSALALAIAFCWLGCVHEKQAPNTSLAAVRGGMRLSEPLDDCLAKSLRTFSDPTDLGRVSVQSSRVMRQRSANSNSTLQLYDVRFFQSQRETGPRFVDGQVAERSCADGTFYLEVDAVLRHRSEAPPDGDAVAKRVDALLEHVRGDCRANPLEVAPAEVENASPGSCAD